MDIIEWASKIPVHDLSDGKGLCRVIFAEDFLNALKELQSAQPEERTEKRTETHACDLVSRQAAIDAINSYFGFNTEEEYGSAVQEVINGLPSAQPTLCGYNIEHLELIARVLQRENLPPERVAEVLTDIGGIVAMVKDELEQALRKQAIERLIRLTGCETNEEITARMDASVTDSEGWLGGVAACIDELEDMQGEWEAKK